MEKILIVDDDVYIGDVVGEVLSRSGYNVLRAYSGTEAKLLLERDAPDLVLLDLMLPGLSGEELLPLMRGIPVIVMSAKADVEDKVSLLLGGAADYITKPFDTRELVARVKVALRRPALVGGRDTLSFCGITLDLGMRTVSPSSPQPSGGEAVRLTPTEFAILKALLSNPSRVVTKSSLLDRIAEETPDCTESSLKTHVSNLRGKLRGISGKDMIEAVWGIGFRLSEE